MIHTIEFSNYRIFAFEQKIRLAPITIIFGKNNTGKSALLRLPLLIASALQGGSSEVFLKTVNDVKICDEYRDVIYGKANKAINIKITSTVRDTLEVSFFVDSTDKELQCHIESWILTASDGQQIAIHRDENNELRTQEDRIVYFNGIIPQNDINDWAKEVLKHFAMSVEYIESIRSMPKRDYRLQENKINIVGSKGQYAYDFIINDESLLNKVSSWYKENFDGWEISIDKTKEPVYYINLQQQNIKNNILDTGAGIAQSMPVIISLGVKNNTTSKLTIIEEPETHLHPAAHATMAEYIATEIISTPSRQVCIETHSLNFILRLRLMIAERKLKHDDIALYYIEFNNESGCSHIKEVIVNDDGTVSDWPTGVFNESLDEALKLRTAQMHK